MSMISRIAGTAAAFVVVGIGVAALDYLIKKQQRKIDADIAASEQDALEAAAEELDKQELADAAALDANAEQAQAVDSDPAAHPPVEPLAGYTPRPDNGPNQNPVLDQLEQVPRKADGTVDASKICSPEDFSDWEDLGCQG